MFCSLRQIEEDGANNISDTFKLHLMRDYLNLEKVFVISEDGKCKQT